LPVVLSTAFLAGAGLTLCAALLFTWLNVPLQELGWVRRIHSRLDRLRRYAIWLICIGMSVPLFAAALDGYLFHYELGPIPTWLRVAQGVTGALLLIPNTRRLGALGVFALYLLGAARFGLHPLLDYLAWPGAAYYLAVHSTNAKDSGVPVLYITTGLSLAWAAIEKWVFPDMALDILTHNPIPTFGFPQDAFLVLSGWIELGVAYLLITGVLNRFLSLVVTLLFVMTSSLFGVREITGHWLLHAILLTFLIEGTGRYITPVLWHRPRWLQLSFVSVTVIPFVGGLMWLYYRLY